MTEQVIHKFPKPTRTSYSALTTFEACPLSYMLYYLDGHKTEAGAAANRGTRLHEACEKFLKGEIEITKLSIDFFKIKQLLQHYKDLGAKAEEVWLCDNDGNYQEEENAATRFKAVVDIHYVIGKTLYIVDLKTGRAYPEHADQLQAYATIGFARYPEVEAVEVAPLYLEGLGHPTGYNRAFHPHLVNFWRGRWDKLFDTNEYPATPSLDACRYCQYRASKMGLCVYG